jgi:hypothetical protein
MDDSGHSGAGMSSAMSAIVQTSLREVFFFRKKGRESGGAIGPMPVLAPHMHIDAPTHLLHLKRLPAPTQRH